MRIILRVDASTKMGSGHIMRCLTLAVELKKNGSDITFISRAHEGNLNEMISKQGMEVIELPAPSINNSSDSKQEGDDYQAWLGVAEEQDAEETIRAIEPDLPDCLIVDHYSFGENWEKQLRPYVKNIMVIDDLADRPHDCDLLLNQNYSKNGADRYQDIVPKRAVMFLGPKYALLRKEYTEARKTLRKRNGNVERVLIFLGGSDPENLTAMALNAFSHPELESIILDVVIGVNHLKQREIKAKCESRGRAQCHTMLPHLADLMSGADLCIGAGGSTTWERLCLGLPSIVITTGENQESPSEALAQDGYHQYLGPAAKVTTDMIAGAIKFLANSPKILERQSNSGKALVDGLGVQRVLKQLLNQEKIVNGELGRILG